MELTYKSFVRKPFSVEAVLVTKENIAELAPMIGELQRDEEKNLPYIQVDQKKVPNVTRVWPGYWVTKMGPNVRAYTGYVFNEQFVESSESIDRLVKAIQVDLALRSYEGLKS